MKTLVDYFKKLARLFLHVAGKIKSPYMTQLTQKRPKE